MSGTKPSEILVLGLGNPILSDDGVGICVVHALKERLETMGVASMEGGFAGLGFLDAIEGYRKAIVVDSVRTGQGKPGDVYRLGLEDMEGTGRMAGSHDFGLADVLGWAKGAGLRVPDEVTFLAVEVQDVGLGEGCTAVVRRAVPKVAQMVVAELEQALECCCCPA